MLLILALALGPLASAQTAPPPAALAEARELPPNALFVTGSSLFFRSGVQLTYERELTAFEAGYWRGLRARVGGGYTYQEVPFSGRQKLLTLVAGGSFIGGRHLDVGAGLVLDQERYNNTVQTEVETDECIALHEAGEPAPPRCIETHEVRGVDNQLLPQVHVAYRIQKPGSPWLFRIGIGFPDGLFFSAGRGF